MSDSPDDKNEEAVKPDYIHQEISDSPRDAEHLKNEEFTIDLPEVKDIPGQEHVQVPSMAAIGDTTAASDDEEGVGIFDDSQESGQSPDDDSEADVTSLEAELLESADLDQQTNDARQLKNSFLDEVDEDGDPINEGSMGTDVSGGDLDTANSEDDDLNEEIGEEDEENNSYSIGGDDNNEPPQD